MGSPHRNPRIHSTELQKSTPIIHTSATSRAALYCMFLHLDMLKYVVKTTYSLCIGFRSRLGQRHGLQNTTLTSYFYKKYLWKSDICILLLKYLSRQIYSYNFYICKLNNLKVIDDLYSQCLTQTLSKTTSKTDTEGVLCRNTKNN
jgi:hypothetical protein